jgi:predicted DNA-binding transcriptional regulator AlpA
VILFVILLVAFLSRAWTVVGSDPLLTLPQVSELTGLAHQTLYGLRSRGEGPPSFRVAGRIRYRQSAVEAWLQAQERAEQDRLSRLRIAG